MDRRAYRIKDFCAAFGIGRTTVYGEIRAGRLRAVKVLDRTLIPSESADEWWRGVVGTADGKRYPEGGSTDDFNLWSHIPVFGPPKWEPNSEPTGKPTAAGRMNANRGGQKRAYRRRQPRKSEAI